MTSHSSSDVLDETSGLAIIGNDSSPEPGDEIAVLSFAPTIYSFGLGILYFFETRLGRATSV
jgi:hypothetical protein